MKHKCRGLGVALATPFLPDGHLDTTALVQLCQHVTAGGADFLVVLGSTGEASMLTEIERDEVICLVQQAAGNVPVFVGTGASSTWQALAWTRRAKELGAEGALIVVPPYTRPTQQGLIAHFTAIAEAVPDLPLILYNVPSRTSTNLLPATLQQLWELPNAIAIKESSGDLQQIGRIAAALPAGKTLLAGDDPLALATIAAGGHGLISVAGNVEPGKLRDLIAAARAGDFDNARLLNNALQPLFDALASEPNPIPLKTALALVGICEPAMRLPLVAANDQTRERLQHALLHLQTKVAHA